MDCVLMNRHQHGLFLYVRCEKSVLANSGSWLGIAPLREIGKCRFVGPPAIDDMRFTIDAASAMLRVNRHS
jgi:hypothetical protein